MRNKSLDILKFISSVFVVFIHIMFVGEFGVGVKAVVRFAVPIFFMSSGYFSYNAITTGNTKKLLNRCLPLLKILAVSIVVYAIFELVFTQSYTFLTDLKSMKAYIKLFVFNNFNDSFFIPLWFLVALIYTYLAIAVVVKLKAARLIKYMPLLLLVSVLFYDVLTGYMGMVLSQIYVRNFLFTGLPFFSLGYLLYENKARTEKIPRPILVILVIVGAVISLMECKFFNDDGNTYFGTLLMSFSLFEISVGLNVKINNERLSYCLSKMPLYIYVLHTPINSVFKSLSLNNTINGYIYPPAVLLATCIIAILITCLKFSLIQRENKKSVTSI
ncbi:MAG: acyltransferase family protein [Eubacterium sp.]